MKIYILMEEDDSYSVSFPVHGFYSEELAEQACEELNALCIEYHFIRKLEVN